MDDAKCQENIKNAEAMMVTAEALAVDYWEGYIVGMKSHYYHDPEQHYRWLQKDEAPDLRSFAQGRGYKAGCSGVPFMQVREWEHYNTLQESFDTRNEVRKDSCFVATVVYGDSAHPDVLLLQWFRDNILRRYVVGRIMIFVYYHTGPLLAKLVGRFTWMKVCSTTVIQRIVSAIRQGKTGF